MTLRTSMEKTQKPLGGLLVVLLMVVFGGAGCAMVQDAEVNIATATVIVQEKTSALQAAIESAQETYEKAKAIYEILNPETESEPETTPSVPPSEDQPQPATVENTSSQ